MKEVWLGKISRASFGHGGYQGAMIGFGVTILGTYGVSDFWGYWAGDRGEGTKWTEHDRLSSLGITAMRIGEVLADAKVDSVSDLVGKPVEVTSEDGTLKSWRILTEVL